MQIITHKCGDDGDCRKCGNFAFYDSNRNLIDFGDKVKVAESHSVDPGKIVWVYRIHPVLTYDHAHVFCVDENKKYVGMFSSKDLEKAME